MDAHLQSLRGQSTDHSGGEESPSTVSGAPPTSSERVAEWLRSPAAYPERPKRVEVIETHISWVFLAGEHAYKLKKPVALGFCDFSTEPLRRRACLNESRLNRRLAPQVYLGEVPITVDRHGKFHLGGTGTPVDWVVKMRRLPAEDALDRRLAAGTLSAADFDRIGDGLFDFFSRLPPVPLLARDYVDHVTKHVRDNWAELLQARHHLDRLVVRRIHGTQQRWLKLWPQVLEARVCDGRIVEGHGDLRPEHIFVTPQLAVIDCLEFSQELRQIDVLDEIAFLAMELAQLGHADLGERLFERYCQVSGDAPPVGLWAFYKSYRACVRAKVAALRASQTHGPLPATPAAAAARYLELALQYSAAICPPLLIVVSGLSGTGKSTLAQHLAEMLDLDWVQTDAIRRELFGASRGETEYGEGNYRPECRERVYEAALQRAGDALQDGLSVVLDGTFSSADLLRKAAQVGSQAGARFLVVRCACSEELAAARISQRAAQKKSLSEVQPEHLAAQRQAQQAVPQELVHLEVDTSGSPLVAVESILAQLRASA